MKKHGNLGRKAFWVLIVPALAFIGLVYAQDVCQEITGTFTEYFDNTTYKDEQLTSVSHWGEGYITLNKLGSNFTMQVPPNFPTWVNTVASGDFDGDGWPEFVASSSEFCNAIAFVDNLGPAHVNNYGITQWVDGSVGPIYPASGNPTRGINNTALDAQGGHCGMTSGDFDRDGDIDFLYIVSSRQAGNEGEPKQIWLYRNMLHENGSMSFQRTNLTASLSAAIVGDLWSANFLQSIDFDGDNDVDILMGNRAGNVILWRNSGAAAVGASTFNIESPPVIQTGWGGRGVSTIAVADLDHVNGPDIVVGSVSYPDLLYYQNDGTGHFALFDTIGGGTGSASDQLFPGACTVLLAADFNQDGWIEIVAGCDNWNYQPNGVAIGGLAYYLSNTRGELTSYLIYDGRPSGCYDFDLGALLDSDHDGVMDFMIADGNHAQDYYLFINSIADVYATSGQGVSTNVTPGLDSARWAITKVKLSSLVQHVQGSGSSSVSVTFYVSNDDGMNWEIYRPTSSSVHNPFVDANIHNVSDTGYHQFEHFGNRLKWKAELEATADPALQAQFGPASLKTPYIDTVQLEYVYVERREYSRSTAATNNPLNEHELIIAATFFFPGWQGHLRAYDVHNMGLQSVNYTTLQTVSESDQAGGRTLPNGATIAWDAGEILNSASPDARTIYTAIRASKNINNPLQRIDFTTGNVGTLASFLGENDNLNANLINFVRGAGRYWKLGDIDHSNPVVVGPPEERASPQQGLTGYAAFVTANANRTKVVYVGANDGMLHCFRVSDGVELWGFIPYNLLPKLKNMFGKDTATGDHYFVRDVFVDGSASVQDVYYGSQWRTVLVCGQGRGKGSTVASGTNSVNFYFALDVTDPANPRPLWEFTNQITTGSGSNRRYYMPGETWSVPAIARVQLSSGSEWVAFMGSGYDNISTARYTVGSALYATRIEPANGGAGVQPRFVTNDSNFINRFVMADVDTSTNSNPAGYRFANIVNCIPGSPTALDIDQDGYAEYVYFGDLDGRLYRLSVTNSNPDSWSAPTAIYTDRLHLPIITKPFAWLDTSGGNNIPKVYFGTGGDDRAPATYNYAFLAINDTGVANPPVAWYIGIPSYLNLPAGSQVGDQANGLGVGYKVWADPVYSDSIIYFSTLLGSIEAVDPCSNLAGAGKLYGRFVQAVSGGTVGGSAFKTAQNQTAESLSLISKARRAVTLGEQGSTSGQTKRSVYIQEYNSALERLEQPIAALLKIKSWREIYKIFR
jgi:hypothetical protein